MSILSMVKGNTKSPADVVMGSCAVEHPLLDGYRKNMAKILPHASSLVVMAAAHTKSALSSDNIQVRQYDTVYTYNRVRDLSLQLAREIESLGLSAVAVPAFIPIDMLGEGKGMKGEICWRSAGVAAGLGFIGKNNLLVTNTFGPRVRVGGVLTNYPLPHFKKEDGGADGSTACKDCSACLDSCPTGALAEFTVNKKKCGDYIFSYGLRRFSGFMDELLGAGEKEREELLKSAVMRELWQNFMTGCYYYCWECQSSCPVGNHRRR